MESIEKVASGLLAFSGFTGVKVAKNRQSVQ